MGSAARDERRVVVTTAALWITAFAVLAITAVFFRRWHLRWGATDQEVAGPMPGDDLLDEASFHATRAITIDAPPEAVWPWIVQMGFGRGGFYSYDLLDNLGKPSADRIIPELQDLRIGMWIPMDVRGTITDETAFRVRAFDPASWMLWEKRASTWAWRLTPIDHGRTRLITRLRCRYRWRRPTIVTDLLLMEVADFFMMRKAMLGIKRRAELDRSLAPSSLTVG